MLWIIHRLAERLKALLLADVSLDLEAEFAARQVDRQAELLRKARECEEQGLECLAEELRGRAGGLTSELPPAMALTGATPPECQRSLAAGSRQESQQQTRDEAGHTANGATAKAAAKKAARKPARR